MNAHHPFRAVVSGLGPALVLVLFLAPPEVRGQGTQLHYDASGNLSRVQPLTGTAPVLSGPQNVLLSYGDLVSLTVLARGTPPLSYQWQHHSNSIPGATADSLWVRIIAPGDFGPYRVLVSNVYGSATSTNAL